MRRLWLARACCCGAAALPFASTFSMGGVSNPMPLRIRSSIHRMNRRYKQQLLCLPITTLRPSSTLSLATAANEQESTKVIVVGAGFAGLSAAYNLWKLANSSQKSMDIQILEVRDRIGGRVHPISIADDMWIDLGGQWLHESCPENPIRRIMEDDLELGFVDNSEKNKKNRFHKRRLRNALFGADGKPLNTASVQRAKVVFYKAMDDDYYGVKDKNSVSIRDLLDARTKIEKFSDEKRNRSISSSTSFDLAMNYFVHRMEENEGEKLEEVSAFLDLYRELGGPDRVVQGSYQSLLKALSSKMGFNKEEEDNNQRCKVQLRQNAKVERIEYGDSSRISLSFVDTEGDCTATTMECDYCVCTVPLGVLQQRKIDFLPALPQARQEAIDGIGMGLLNKIVFVFDLDKNNKFWGDLEQFGICHEDPSLIKTYYDCTNDYCDLNPNSAILVQFLAGSAADRVDPPNNSPCLTDDEAIEESLEALRFVFGNIPNPTVAKVTRWRQDPWACGSYSFAKVGSSEEMYDEIASPLGRLLFAGEHTSKHYHSTVHGAWETGDREAHRIFDQLRRWNGN